MNSSIDEDGIYNALKDENLVALEEFIKKGLNINHVFTATTDKLAHGKTLVQFAVSCHVTTDSPALRYVLAQPKCDVNVVFKITGCRDNVSQVKLIRHRDRLHKTCLFTAICRQDPELTKLLVSAGADVNLYDSQLCSALWHAVDIQDERLVDIFLAVKSIDVDVADKHHISPLHVAALHTNPNIVQKLVDRSARVDTRNLRGMTPLVVACHKKQSLQTAHVLLRHGADPNATSTDGVTALTGVLTRHPCEEGLVSLLIEAGADVVHTIKFMSRTLSFTRTLVDNPSVLSLLLLHMEAPRSLKILSALRIKLLLSRKVRGRSVYELLEKLPLPKLLIHYMKLE